MMGRREELEASIAHEQARVDEMKRRRMRKRPDGTEVQAHAGYDQEIDEVDDRLSSLRAQLARLSPPIVIFKVPPREFEGMKFEDGSSIPKRLHGIEVVRNGQTVRSVGGRARVFDSYDMLLGGRLVLTGTRRDVMFQAVRAADVGPAGIRPLITRIDEMTYRQRTRLIRAHQIANRRSGWKSRRVRKACRMLAQKFVSRVFKRRVALVEGDVGSVQIRNTSIGTWRP